MKWWASFWFVLAAFYIFNAGFDAHAGKRQEVIFDALAIIGCFVFGLRDILRLVWK
jgi:hypothetical protein